MTRLKRKKMKKKNVTIDAASRTIRVKSSVLRRAVKDLIDFDIQITMIKENDGYSHVLDCRSLDNVQWDRVSKLMKHGLNPAFIRLDNDELVEKKSYHDKMSSSIALEIINRASAALAEGEWSSEPKPESKGIPVTLTPVLKGREIAAIDESMLPGRDAKQDAPDTKQVTRRKQGPPDDAEMIAAMRDTRSVTLAYHKMYPASTSMVSGKMRARMNELAIANGIELIKHNASKNK